MIVNNVITYGNYPSPFESWRPTGDITYGLVTAVVATIFSYQCTATLHDLLFGLKPAGRAKVSHICLYLPASSSSPTFMYRVLRRNSNNDEMIGGASRPERKSKCRCKRNAGTPLKLVIILVFASAMNVSSILATLEHDQFLTFSEADFKGVALGVNNDLSVLPIKAIPFGGARMVPETALQDTALAQFGLRTNFHTASKGTRVPNPLTGSLALGTGNSTAFVELSIAFRAALRLVILSRQIQVSTGIKGMVFTPTSDLNRFDSSHVLRHNMDSEGMIALSAFGGRLISEWCGQEGSGETVSTAPRASEQMRVDRAISCDNEGRMEDLMAVAQSIMAKVTLVNSHRLEIIRHGGLSEEGAQFSDGGNIRFLKRRMSRLSLPMLSVMAILALSVRIIVAVLTRNDIAAGIELILKEAFRVPWHDSMLSKNVRMLFDPESDFVEVCH